ncbi:hypothetical protein [Lentibacillus juripiscarius]|uniref:Uncharacterized protein n=1 Tax=Lentibacillus juripiscarius TaxID=257446 RepID=A0ABW5V8K8_9BACI
MESKSKMLNNEEPILITRWYIEDIKSTFEKLGIEASEENLLKAAEEVKLYFSGVLVPYGNEILEIMLSNLFEETNVD